MECQQSRYNGDVAWQHVSVVEIRKNCVTGENENSRSELSANSRSEFKSSWGVGGAVSPPQWGPGRSPEKIFEISLKLFYSGAIWEARINGQTGITLAQDMIAEYSTSKYQHVLHVLQIILSSAVKLNHWWSEIHFFRVFSVGGFDIINNFQTTAQILLNFTSTPLNWDSAARDFYTDIRWT